MGSRTAKGYRVNYIYMSIYQCIHLLSCVCVCVYIYIYIYIYICIIPTEAGKDKLEPAEDKVVYFVFVCMWCEWEIEMLSIK